MLPSGYRSLDGWDGRLVAFVANQTVGNPENN